MGSALRCGRCGALSMLLATACLPDNPDGTDTDTPDPTGSGDTGVVPETSMLGCPAGQTCPLLFVAQAFDDRVEIFAPADDAQAYRGTIDFDLRPGTGTDELDEPFGIALSEDFLHVVAGHHPTREEGTLVSIPRAFLGDFDAGASVPVSSVIAGGAFQAPVVATPFGVPEPIFMLERPLAGRLVIGTFNNDLFSTEDLWTEVGIVHVVDAADPTSFGTRELVGFSGGDCIGAAQIVTLEDDAHAAVACDGNEAVAFLDLGMLGTGSPEAAAAAITGKVCSLPPLSGRRVRYLAYDGVDGVIVGLGPGLESQMASGEIYSVQRSDCELVQREIGINGQSHPAEIVRRDTDFLVASGSGFPDPKRGVFVLTASGEVCEEPIAGFDWETAGDPNNPLALALSSSGNELAVGAGAFAQGEPQATAFGAVLWATLSGSGCDTTATVVDLTDGGPGHAPAADPVDTATYRRQPAVVVLREVQG